MLCVLAKKYVSCFVWLNYVEKTNCTYFQICYEVTHDIPAGRELLVKPRMPLYLRGRDSHDEEQSEDRETGN